MQPNSPSAGPALLRDPLHEQTVELYARRFHARPSWVTSAPGRVNLIGEHTDYNDGYVFPAAIDRYVAVAAGRRHDRMVHAFSENLHSGFRAPLIDLDPSRAPSWGAYLKGVAQLLMRAGIDVPGVNLLVQGTIPRGAGLSSSAALEISLAHALLAAAGATMDDLEVIRIAQRAEQEFAGVQCGIMDQFIAQRGRRGHGLLLDCRSLEFEQIPLPGEVLVLVIDTGVRRALHGSDYNARRQECAAAVAELSRVRPGLTSLRDLLPGELPALLPHLDSLLARRVRHVVTENDRVLRAADALRRGDTTRLGSLLYGSHLSLRSDYEVSCLELDALVDICAECDCVLGARMTGAGFGGSIVCLAGEQGAREIAARVQVEYPERTGQTAILHVCSVEDGAMTRTV
jgi:galactokinase